MSLIICPSHIIVRRAKVRGHSVQGDRILLVHDGHDEEEDAADGEEEGGGKCIHRHWQ